VLYHFSSIPKNARLGQMNTATWRYHLVPQCLQNANPVTAPSSVSGPRYNTANAITSAPEFHVAAIGSSSIVGCVLSRVVAPRDRNNGESGQCPVDDSDPSSRSVVHTSSSNGLPLTGRGPHAEEWQDSRPATRAPSGAAVSCATPCKPQGATALSGALANATAGHPRLRQRTGRPRC
jgi:hypothetical protein